MYRSPLMFNINYNDINDDTDINTGYEFQILYE